MLFNFSGFLQGASGFYSLAHGCQTDFRAFGGSKDSYPYTSFSPNATNHSPEFEIYARTGNTVGMKVPLQQNFKIEPTDTFYQSVWQPPASSVESTAGLHLPICHLQLSYIHARIVLQQNRGHHQPHHHDDRRLFIRHACHIGLLHRLRGVDSVRSSPTRPNAHLERKRLQKKSDIERVQSNRELPRRLVYSRRQEKFQDEDERRREKRKRRRLFP